MGRTTKLHLGSAAYCGVLISLNWWRNVDYARAEGRTSETGGFVGVAFLVSLAVVVVLAWRAVTLARRRLEQGQRVADGRWIESWSVLLYPLPLLWQHVSTSSWAGPEGTLVTASGGFGHALSSQVFLLALAGLLLAQITRRLSPRQGA